MAEVNNTHNSSEGQPPPAGTGVRSPSPEKLRSLIGTIFGPKRDRRVVAWSIGILVVGIFTSLFGIVLMTGRRSVAHYLLGANFMMDMPMAQADVAKVQLAGCGGFLVFALGGLIFAVSLIIGLMQLAKSE